MSDDETKHEGNNIDDASRSTADELDFDKLEQEVMEKIPTLNLDELKTVAEILNKEDGEAAIDTGMSSRKLLRVILRYLNSEEIESKEDEGVSLFCCFVRRF